MILHSLPEKLLALLPHTIRAALPVLAALSLVTFVGSLIAIPVLVARLPVDFFKNYRTRCQYELSWHTVPLLLLKNCLGLLFILAGLAMLVLPGQGLLTLLIGCLLCNFPGKDQLIQTLIGQQRVRALFDWSRKKMQKVPFDWPD